MKSNTKSRIRETALAILAAEGYGGTSIRKIAKEVGVRESAVYNHFSSKDEIIKSVFEEIASESKTADLLTDELLDLLGKPEKFLKKFCRVLVDHWTTERQVEIFRFMIVEEFRQSEIDNFSLRESLNEMRGVWEMIFTQMKSFGVIKKINPAVTANEFIAPLFFIRSEYLSDKNKIDKKTALTKIDEHIEFFWEAIRK